ncbi:MAG: YbaK/EbsC family protein [Clostridia bacterium]|nr:YbaK/EbsC family protein [Clostridia bacterium]
MSVIAKVQEYVDGYNVGIKAIEFTDDTSTSELAAQVLGVEVGQIAKSLLFLADGRPVLVVTSGDVRVDQKKLKRLLGVSKVKFADPDTVYEVTGYQVGGVCPIALNKPVNIYVDESLHRFPVVYAAAGTPSSALPVTVEQLLTITGGQLADLA